MGIKGLELDMRRLLALQYFKNKRLSLDKAAKLAGMNRFETGEAGKAFASPLQTKTV